MITLRVNGSVHNLDIESETPLLWALREQLGLTGSKYGCGVGECGACTVLIEGEPALSCVTSVDEAAEVDITTIEGFQTETAVRLRKAWTEMDVVQCGYCQSGQIMTAAALLDANPAPTDDDIDEAMAGVLCRCGTYQDIRAAIHRAASERRDGK